MVEVMLLTATAEITGVGAAAAENVKFGEELDAPDPLVEATE